MHHMHYCQRWERDFTSVSITEAQTVFCAIQCVVSCTFLSFGWSCPFFNLLSIYSICSPISMRQFRGGDIAERGSAAGFLTIVK